ncbi:MAG: right-handed parallel beta-helix repeat-containing protein, partial [Thermoanaerobaculia bacterium]
MAANAATYYVATSGNDANPGTLAAPFKTIKKAASMTTAGDQVLVRGGVYNGQVGVLAKGTASARITIKSYPGELAVIDGTGTAANTDLVNFYKAAYVDFSGFEVRNSTRIGISLWGSNNIRLLGNDVHHSVRNGIYAGYDAQGVSTDITVHGNRVHDNVLENQYHTFTNGGWASGINISMTNRGAITNNEVYRNFGEGLGSGLSDNVTIRGNKVYDNFSVNIYLDNAQKMVVDRNFVYTTGNTNYFRDGYPAAGIGLANEAWDFSMPTNNITITNNIVVDGRWGFFFLTFEAGGVMNNITIANNTFYKGRQAVIEIASVAHVNSLVYNNIFYQSGGSTTAKVGGTGVTYKSNLWYGGQSANAASPTDIYADPKFVNPGGLSPADYKLQQFSPAVHRGVATAATTDYFGGARTVSFDIGAHELSAQLGSSDAGAVELTAPAD